MAEFGAKSAGKRVLECVEGGWGGDGGDGGAGGRGEGYS